mgnify:FL=1
MNAFVEEFIKKYYLNDTGQSAESALESAERINENEKIESVESIVDFLFSNMGFASKTLSPYQRRAFFKNYPEYAAIEIEITRRQRAFLKKMAGIKVSPQNDMTASDHLSIKKEDYLASIDSNGMHIYINHIANETIPVPTERLPVFFF